MSNSTDSLPAPVGDGAVRDGNRLLRTLWVTALTTVMLATGCATVEHPDPKDPWESYNRSMTSFNTSVDNAVLKPVAKGYKKVVPRMARTGVTNFFGNLGDVWSFANNILQAKPEPALHSFWRVVVNTTIGLGGLLDPATEMRLERHKEDFGQTLGWWGVQPGPYLVLPFLGPSTLRDAAALPVDYLGYPLTYVNDKPVRYSLYGLRFIDVRAHLLEVENLLDSAALDPYTFTRDAFLQRRLNEVHDGDPPEEDEERWDLDD